MSITLFIEPLSEAFAELYSNAANAYNTTAPEERNSGFDLHCDADDVDSTWSAHCQLVSQGCRAAAYDERGRRRAFWLAPRSSISRTPFTLANSLGLIDAGYRGVIKAALRTNGNSECRIDHYVRLTQLAAPDLLPWATVHVVDRLPDDVTARGAGGFGSTGTGPTGPVPTDHSSDTAGVSQLEGSLPSQGAYLSRSLISEGSYFG
jgi:dUTPase